MQVKALAVSTVVTGAVGAAAIIGLKHGGLGARDMADIATWRGAMQAGQYHRVKHCADLPFSDQCILTLMSISGSQEQNDNKVHSGPKKILVLQTDGFIISHMLSTRRMSEIGTTYMRQAIRPIWVHTYVQDLIKEAFQERIRKGAAQTPESK